MVENQKEHTSKTDQQKIEILNRLVTHYGFQHWWEDENPISDWVSMILIQQTTEKNAGKALDNLEGYLTVAQLNEMDEGFLQEQIRPAGFYRQKSRYIKELINWFVGHGGDFQKFASYSTEDLRKELLSIKGVGAETADVMLLYIFNRKVFIADQYAIRLFNRLGFGNYHTYQEMQVDFNPLVNEVSLEMCKEWHAVIDVHGKAFRQNKSLDESWLVKESS